MNKLSVCSLQLAVAGALLLAANAAVTVAARRWILPLATRSCRLL